MAVRFYERYENGMLHSIGIGLDGTEITKERYDALTSEINEKAILEYRLYRGEIAIDSIPAEWQEETQRRVDERRAWEEANAEEEATEDDHISALAELEQKATAYDILTGVSE